MPKIKSLPKKPNKPSSTSNRIRSILFSIFVFIIAVGTFSLLTPPKNLKEVPLSDVITRANDPNGDIKHISVSGQVLEITLKNQDQPSQTSRKDASGTLYEQGLIDHCT